MGESIKLKKGREKSIFRRHPWVFSGAIDSSIEELKEGQVVEVLDFKGNFLAKGHYSNSSLAVKLLSFENEVINADWFHGKLERAKQLRSELNLPSDSTNCYRLAHGEGDGLAGLIVDVYNDIAVIQSHSQGMYQSLEHIKQSLIDLGFERLIFKPVGKEKPVVLQGEIAERELVLEGGLKFNVDIVKGQKTGFFIDQRANRELLRSYSSGKRVLNAFSYTGGFSISALAGGATLALSLDASGHALSVAEENASINGFNDKHDVLKADAVPFLEALDKDVYDVIILDPPAFAKHKSARHNAIQAYRRINEAAMKKISKGGVLFTFSCSQVVDRQMFYDTVVSAAIQAQREVKVLHHLRQPEDHPNNIFHPEGEYLKGLVLKIF